MFTPEDPDMDSEPDTWQGECGQDECYAPLDVDNCSWLFSGAAPDGEIIWIAVCSTCAYQHRLELDME